MKKNTLTVLLILIVGTLGFFGGSFVRDRNRSIESLVDDIKKKEISQINSKVIVDASVKKINEGGWFENDFVYYLEGVITNNCIAATAKDIKIEVEYKTKTGTAIGREDFTVFEFIEPGKTIPIKLKLTIPEDASDYEYRLLEVKGE